MAFLSQTIRRTIRSGESQPTGFGLVLFILMQEISVDSEIVQGPSNTTAKVNESTYFNCSTSIRPVDKNAIWFHFPLDGGGQRNYVYDDGRIMTNYKNRFDIEIDNSTGEFNLLFKRLEIKDAGIYDCRDDPHADIGASANLIVLDSDLVCESDMDPRGVVGPTECERAIAPDKVTLSCSLTYNGVDAPEMVWSRAGDSPTLNDTHCVNIDKRVTCYTTLTANLQLIGSAYTCEVTTQQYNCSLEINNILYAFANATKREYYTGTDVTCTANASSQLSCSYRWYKDNTTEVSSHPTFTPNDPGLYKCQAQCPMRTDSCILTAKVINVSTVPFTDTVSDPGPNYLLHKVLWPILITLLVAGLLLFLIILYRRGLIKWPRRCRRRRSKSVEIPRTSTADPLLEDQNATYSGTEAMALTSSITMEPDNRTEQSLIEEHRLWLEDRMDPDFGLLNELLGNGTLSEEEKSEIEGENPFQRRNCHLLDYILEKYLGDRLIATLQHFEQRHIANYLNANGEYCQEYGLDWPLTKTEISILHNNSKSLIVLLKSNLHDLPGRLYFSRVINKRQMKLTLCRKDEDMIRHSKAQALLDILRRRSIRDYWQMIRCLRQANQEKLTDIADILEPDKVDELGNPQNEMRAESQIDNFSAIYEYYPRINGTIDIKDRVITGLTILDEALFIACESCPMVEVYNAITYKFIHRWNIGLADPGGLESCKSKKCLYIVGWKTCGESRTILKVDTQGVQITEWPVADSWSSLSVAHDSNVILTVQGENKVIEYSPDGHVNHEICVELSSDSGEAFNLWHSVKLACGNFVVCGSPVGLDGNLHRVFIVDNHGTLQLSFSESDDFNIAKLDEPVYLLVDKEGYLLLADRNNHRVLLFNSNLECQKELLFTENNKLRFPSILCLDTSGGLLHVAESDSRESRVLMFKLRS